MKNIASLDRASAAAVQLTRDVIQEPAFCEAHRLSDKCFIRRRKLTFVKVMVTLLQKTVRSIQLHLHDFFGELGQNSAVASFWCEARLKLKHTAFIELNRRAILEVAYGGRSGFQVRRWKGHRLLAMDSSLIRLPQEAAVGQEFGCSGALAPVGTAGRDVVGSRFCLLRTVGAVCRASAMVCLPLPG